VSALGDLAVSYAAAGQNVFALAPGGKHPHPTLAPHGFLDATADVGEVDRLWTVCPNANIGGRPSPSVVVLDVDPRNGGDRELDRLQHDHDELPLTLTSRTGGGGLHLFFGCAGSTRGKLGSQGIEIKSHRNGYVVLPESVHPAGPRYEWLREMPIAPAPCWLVKLLRPSGRAEVEFNRSTGDPSRRAQALLNVVLQSPEGDRNNRLFWACARAGEAGIDLNPLIDAGVHIGLSRAEATRTAQSAASRVVV
jgi:hypothetical protein